MWYEDKKWWKHAFDRAIRSLAQGVLLGIGENVIVQDFDWKMILGASNRYVYHINIHIGFHLGSQNPRRGIK
jgi:hypothetical protein